MTAFFKSYKRNSSPYGYFVCLNAPRNHGLFLLIKSVGSQQNVNPTSVRINVGGQGTTRQKLLGLVFQFPIHCLLSKSLLFFCCRHYKWFCRSTWELGFCLLLGKSASALDSCCSVQVHPKPRCRLSGYRVVDEPNFQHSSNCLGWFCSIGGQHFGTYLSAG